MYERGCDDEGLVVPDCASFDAVDGLRESW